MSAIDARLIVAAVFGIALSVGLIVRGRLHPFVALLCGAFAVGLAAGMPGGDIVKAIQNGAGDILGGTGLIVALGLSLGAMLQISDGAAGLARVALRLAGRRGAPWASMAAALLLGLPLFFETGLVLLLPIVGAAAATLTAERGGGTGDERLRLMLPALAGLSVVHALVPPHPGPLLAVAALHADLARTMGYGLLVGLPTAAIAGPLLSRLTARGVAAEPAVAAPALPPTTAPATAPASLLVILLPVALIAAGQAQPLLGTDDGWLSLVGNPIAALLLACLAALPLLFGRRLADASVQAAIWDVAMRTAGPILLAIGAGGALKQVLVSAGLADLLSRYAATSALSPLLLAWGVAVGIRLATGSATVATITAAGLLTGVVARTGVSPEWTVLAIGAGSLFFSHVNDPGFWLVRSYLGLDTRATFRTWSVMETVISVVGLVLVLGLSRLF